LLKDIAKQCQLELLFISGTEAVQNRPPPPNLLKIQDNRMTINACYKPARKGGLKLPYCSYDA